MRASFVLAFTLVSSALVFAACSGSDDNVPASGTSASSGSSGSSGSSASSASSGSTGSNGSSGEPACTPLTQEGQAIDIKGAKPPVPEATGGTPVDGTYVLTSVRAFTTIIADGATFRAFGAYTLKIGGGGTTFEQVVTNENGEVTNAKGALIVNGVDFTARPSCEQPLPEAGVTVIAGKYTFEGTTLKMYVVRDLGITAELLFSPK